MASPRVSRLAAAALVSFLAFAVHAARSRAAEEAAPLQELQVRAVVMDPRTQQPVVLLEDKKAGKVLPIWVGPAEAHAILLELNKVAPPRPLTHDLMRTLLGALKGEVARVVITELRGGTYFALVDIKGPGRSFSMDSRPSDAIALALRMKAPIFAKREVLESAVPLGEGRRESHQERLGLVLQPMTPALAKFFGGGKPEGLLVAQVREDAPAARAGLRRGDVILQAAGKPVTTPERFEEIFRESNGSLTLAVRRGAERGEDVNIRIEFDPSGGASPQ